MCKSQAILRVGLLSQTRICRSRKFCPWQILLLFMPNRYFEIRVLKCLCVGSFKVPYEVLCQNIARVMPVVDGWAVCDAFCSSLRGIRQHKEKFYQEIEHYIRQGSEFSQRFAYRMLLGYYMEKSYLPKIFTCLDQAHTQYYYTHMGAAWLIAEVLVCFFEEGVSYLKNGTIEGKTKNKAIQKARESDRLTIEQKNYLKSLKNG